MQDGKEKGAGGQHGRARTGSGIRAKNHTIILNSEATGGVRARLRGSAQGGGSLGRIGGLEEPDASSDPSWESPKVSSEMLVTKAQEAAPMPHEGGHDEALEHHHSEEISMGREDATSPLDEYLSSEATSPSSREVDLLDPLGLFDVEEEGAATVESERNEAEGFDTYREGDIPEFTELTSESVLTEYDSEFRPDPLPDAVRVEEEEHMVVGAGTKREEIAWKAITPLVGFLVSFDFDENGSYLELRTGRLIVTSQREASGSCLVLHDQTVSPSHAVMRVASDGTVQVLDQLSESGTRVRRFETGEELLLSGEKSTLGHGDIVSFGDRSFHVCLVMAGSAS